MAIAGKTKALQRFSDEWSGYELQKAQLTSLTDSQQRLLLSQLLREKSQLANRFPMSAGQQGLWHAFRRDSKLTAFNVFLPTRIRGPLDTKVLKQSINCVAQRHSALRTTFTDAGSKLSQIVHLELQPEFVVHQVLGESESQIRESVDAEVRRPFCLERGPLLRVIVYQVSEQDWLVLAITHHIIVDFWSLVVILSELRTVYPEFGAGRQPQLPAAPDNYREFVLQQQSLLSSDLGCRLLEFWQKELQETSQVLELPTDFVRPSAFTHQAESVPIQIESQTARRVSQLAIHLRSTPFAVVHAALQVLLQRYSRQETFFIGSPFSGRCNQKYEQTVGFFINMLPVKASPKSEQSFEELIVQTTVRLMEILDHEAMPISEIVRQAAIARDPSRSPLFQVSYTFERAQKREELGRAGFLFPDQTKKFEFAGMQQESFYVSHPTCHYDLEFVFEHSDDGLSAMLIYCRDLFSASSMQHMSHNFTRLLDSLLVHSSLPLARVPWNLPVSSQEVYATSTLMNPQVASQSTLAAPEMTVHESIGRTVSGFPNQPALECSRQSLSYVELQLLAKSLCDELTRFCAQPQQLIPVLCQQGSHAFVAMLAVQLCGCAAVPIDMTQPSANVDRIIQDLDCRVVLTDCPDELSDTVRSGRRCLSVDLQSPLPCNERSDFFNGWLGDNHQGVTDRLLGKANDGYSKPDSLAYMIYTSGSTGEAKGVLVEHRSICNTLGWRAKSLPLTTQDRILMLLSHQFDAALGIGWSVLTQGATIVWPDTDSKRDPALLIQCIREQGITILPVVPSLLRVLVQHPDFDKCSSLRAIWTGGEPLPSELPSIVRRKLSVRLWNLYGPTEAAVEATAVDITEHLPQAQMTIGKPIEGMQVFIVDTSAHPVPTCVPGEIAIAGPGLARGYLGDPDLTAMKFVTHPVYPQQRIYLTGDLGRAMPDGQIEFLGRLDHQVKLRGYRIELGEIEAVVQSHPRVDRAAVSVHTSPSGNSVLVAFVSLVKSDLPTASLSAQLDNPSTQPKEVAAIEVAWLHEFLADRLPPYKRPTTSVVLKELPLTSSGKIDRKRLPAPRLDDQISNRYVPARNNLEQHLIQVWCQELSVEMLGIYQDFFEVGGNSLQAAVVTTRLSNNLGVHVPTALIFDQATIAQIACRLTTLYPAMVGERFGQKVIDFYRCSENLSTKKEFANAHPLLAPLKTTGLKTPLFMVHPPGGIVLCYRELANHLPDTQPLWAIRSRGLHGQETLPGGMAEMAADYIQAIRTVQPVGPYLLGGWSLGGLVAYEMARQLLLCGDHVKRLVFLDTTIPEGASELVPLEEQVNVGLEYGIHLRLDQLGGLTAEEQLPMLYEHATKLGILTQQSAPDLVARVLKDLQHLFGHHVKLSCDYRLQPIAAELLLMRPQEVPFAMKVTEDRGWRHLVSKVRVCYVPGHHHNMVQAPHAERLASRIAEELQ